MGPKPAAVGTPRPRRSGPSALGGRSWHPSCASHRCGCTVPRPSTRTAPEPTITLPPGCHCSFSEDAVPAYHTEFRAHSSQGARPPSQQQIPANSSCGTGQHCPSLHHTMHGLQLLLFREAGPADCTELRDHRSQEARQPSQQQIPESASIVATPSAIHGRSSHQLDFPIPS
jgi:hypothetical protein